MTRVVIDYHEIMPIKDRWEIECYINKRLYHAGYRPWMVLKHKEDKLEGKLIYNFEGEGKRMKIIMDKEEIQKIVRDYIEQKLELAVEEMDFGYNEITAIVKG
jgi:hypothetical protein